MAKFIFYLYEPEWRDSIGLEMEAKLEVKVTRNAERDKIVEALMEKQYDALKATYVENEKKYRLKVDPDEIAIKIDFISSTTKWKDVEYYAHEFNDYFEAKARLVRMRSGRKFYEVSCSEDVMDGYWSYDGGTVENGSGDYLLGV